MLEETFEHRTLIMGVLNATPDSFSDGGCFYENVDAALRHTGRMIDEGADIIDIGGESTRPGASAVSEEEELRRILPIVRAIYKEWGSSARLSIDTCKGVVAEAALAEGASMVNCLGGMMWDPRIVGVVARFGCPIVVYHIRGTPRTMMTGDLTYRDIVEDISEFFRQAIALGEAGGVSRTQFLLDPGIGFGKTVAQNLELIRRLAEFRSFDLPIVVGVSRKAHLGTMLQRALGLPAVPGPLERLEAALAETAIAVRNGARIVRTHDVEPTRRFVAVMDAVLRNNYQDTAQDAG